MISLLAKTKGAGHQVGGNALLGGDRNFWPMGLPGVPKFVRMQKIVGLAGIFKDFYLNQKQKSLCYFKVSQFEIFEKHGCPPLKQTLP